MAREGIVKALKRYSVKAVREKIDSLCIAKAKGVNPRPVFRRFNASTL